MKVHNLQIRVARLVQTRSPDLIVLWKKATQDMHLGCEWFIPQIKSGAYIMVLIVRRRTHPTSDTSGGPISAVK